MDLLKNLLRCYPNLSSEQVRKVLTTLPEEGKQFPCNIRPLTNLQQTLFPSKGASEVRERARVVVAEMSSMCRCGSGTLLTREVHLKQVAALRADQAVWMLACGAALVMVGLLQ